MEKIEIGYLFMDGQIYLKPSGFYVQSSTDPTLSLSLKEAYHLIFLARIN